LSAIYNYNNFSQTFTIKRYGQAKGMSNEIHLDADIKESLKNNYEIKGPFGKGLDMETEGLHVAYSAGTGVLPYLDLVGHLILALLDKHEGTQFL
jgi:NAD(P)H-flavin reductase